MRNINLKVQSLLINNSYYLSLKRKQVKSNYWYNKKDPDGILRDRIKNHKIEKKKFIKNNKNLIKLINSVKFKSFCDLGCGAGYLLSALKKNKRNLGIDNDNVALDLASKYSKVLKLDLDKKYFKINKKFDLIACYHVIEHLKKPEILIKNIHRMLNTNGHLIIGTPDFDSAMARIYKNKYRLLHDQTHISLFSLDSLCRFLRDHKFKIIQLDFPFFETDYFNKKNFLKILNKNKKNFKVSPPFYGNFVTVLAKKI